IKSCSSLESACAEKSHLDGLHCKKHDVSNKTNLFLNKRLSIAHSRKQPVVTRLCQSPLTNLFFRHKEPSALSLSCILRAIGEERLQPLLDIWSNVPDESRSHIGIEAPG